MMVTVRDFSRSGLLLWSTTHVSCVAQVCFLVSTEHPRKARNFQIYTFVITLTLTLAFELALTLAHDSEPPRVSGAIFRVSGSHPRIAHRSSCFLEGLAGNDRPLSASWERSRWPMTQPRLCTISCDSCQRRSERQQQVGMTPRSGLYSQPPWKRRKGWQRRPQHLGTGMILLLKTFLSACLLILSSTMNPFVSDGTWIAPNVGWEPRPAHSETRPCLIPEWGAREVGRRRRCSYGDCQLVRPRGGSQCAGGFAILVMAQFCGQNCVVPEKLTFIDDVSLQ